VADQKKNDVAAALAALAGGAVPSEGETPSGGIPSETTVFSPPPSQAESTGSAVSSPSAPPAPQSRPTMTQPQATRSAPDAINERPRPARSSGPPVSSDNPATSLPTVPRPSLLPKHLPLPSAVPPPARIRPAGSAKERPAMPQQSVEAPPAPPAFAAADPVPELLPELVEDEETIAAAPDASAFARRAVVQKPAHAPIYASLFFRRTLIPILLTCGMLLLSIGTWSMVDNNAPLAAMGTGIDILLIGLGAVLLAFGFLNAFHVKHVLVSATKQSSD
jgi:hypothetical protein